MAVNYVQGDLLEAKEDIIAHGCNCSGGFGSGVAGAIAQKWPYVQHAFRRHHAAGRSYLGTVFMVTMGDKVIANCFTQQKYLPRGIKHADYDAIRDSMRLVKSFAIQNNKTIAIPRIGAGLAGGDWNVIKSILEEVFDDFDITIYTL